MSKDSKSVLMIAYYFPPEGNAAVYRPLRFLKELVKMGWQATVICCEPYRYERQDIQLLSQVPLTTRIVRVKGRDPWRAFQAWRGAQMTSKLAGSSTERARHVAASHHVPWRTKLRELVRTIEACVYRPDIAMPWIRPTIRKTIAVCRRNRPDVIWATIGPLSSGVVAYRASIATGVPYVLDFRDPWGLEYYAEEVRRPVWAKRRDNRMISSMFEKAQAVVFMFESVAQAYLKAFSTLDEARIHIIPNGFEGEVEPFYQAHGDRCTVLYAGTLNSYRYDTLIEGLLELKRKDPKDAVQLRLRFIGEGLQGLAERVASLHLGEGVEILPPTSSADILRLQREAHALLVLGRMPGRNGHELVAGAKLFGYLQAGRPIIGIVPRDETRRILGRVGSPLIADADSPAEIVTVLKKILKAWSNGTLEQLIPDRIACEAYSSNRQIADLIAALNGVSPGKIPMVKTSAVPTGLESEAAQ